MKKQTLNFIVVAWLMTLSPLAFAKVSIFACEPEWAALANEIGKDLVSAKSATNAYQDVHHIRAKPSLLSSMRQADLVICSGSSLEIGWLPILLGKAGGSHVQPNTNGWLMASDYVQKLGVPKKVDRSMGDIHPEGNPHVHLNPHNLQAVANELAKRLALIDPVHAHRYQKNLKTFTQNWQAMIQTWEAEKPNFSGVKVVVYHNGWIYLLKWLGITAVASLEPKPGIPPTASHLSSVLQKIQGQSIRGVLVAPFENPAPAEWLADKANIPIIKLPFTIGGSEQAQDLTSLFNESLKRLK